MGNYFKLVRVGRISIKEIFKSKLNTNALICILFEALYPDVCCQKCFVDFLFTDARSVNI